MADTPGRNGRGREDGLDALIQAAREGYNPPPETPREAIWDAIQDALQAGADSRSGSETQSSDPILDLAAERRRRTFRFGGPVGWAAAAGIVLLMGIGIGRFTAPGTTPTGSGDDPRAASTNAGEGGAAAPEVPGRDSGGTPAGFPDARPTGPAGGRLANTTSPSGSRSGSEALHVAALRHLGQTESLLTMVRTEGRSGSLDPQVGAWARTLLVQTRFLLDAQSADADPAVRRLMEDLELVLAQIVGVTESEATDDSRAKAELDLALKGLNEKEVLTRIQAVS